MRTRSGKHRESHRLASPCPCSAPFGFVRRLSAAWFASLALKARPSESFLPRLPWVLYFVTMGCLEKVTRNPKRWSARPPLWRRVRSLCTLLGTTTYKTPSGFGPAFCVRPVLGVRAFTRARTRFRPDQKVTWLILPVVICLSQRLSHACLSINNFIL
jgi:hypothetical protein